MVQVHSARKDAQGVARNSSTGVVTVIVGDSAEAMIVRRIGSLAIPAAAEFSDAPPPVAPAVQRSARGRRADKA